MEETPNLKKTTLYNEHVEIGAKMVPFAGYMMPVRYTSQIEEHKAVREKVGLFDVSHMGEFIVRGTEASDLIQKITSNDVSKLFPGKIQYSCFPNENGGIIDDLLVYYLHENEYMLVVNAGNRQQDWDWIQLHNTFEAELEDVSESLSLLAVQGPKTTAVLQELTTIDLGGMKYYTFEKGELAGIPDVIISATGYTGSGGFEIYVKNEYAVSLWQKIMESGKVVGIQPAGLGARDTLRLEAGFCLHGNDIDDTTSPIEAGLGWITKFSADFIGAEILQKQKEEGPKRKLVGFKMTDRGIPRQDYLIRRADGEEIGRVTSGTQSPMLEVGIGLGYVKTDYADLGSKIFIDIRSKLSEAEIVQLPFYKN